MARTSRFIFMVLAVAVLMSCATTTIVNSWKAPDAQPITFKKVLVAVVGADQTVRRVGEDRLVARLALRGVDGYPSYKFVPGNEEKDVEKVKARVKEAGIDGAIVMRIVSARTEVNYVSGTYPSPYYSFYGYWGYGWGSPGYVATDQVVRIESNVYSVAQDKLIWAGASETYNPTEAGQLVDEVATAAAAQMRKEGLIP